MKLTFKDLKNFITCAHSKTLSEASDKLEITQPSLSLGIKKIEQELGYPLFFRSKDGIKLTPQGKILLPEAEAVLLGLDRIKGKKVALKFRIGIHSSVGIFILGEFLKNIFQENPSLDFEIVNASSHDVNKMVARGEVDFGIVMNPLSLQGLIVKSIGEDDVYVWESQKRYQNKLIYHPQMLQAHSIISRWKSVPQQIINVQDLELITHLTYSGAGFGIIPFQVVKSQQLPLQRVQQTPSFKDRLSLVCYPEMLRSDEGKLIFALLKRSFNSGDSPKNLRNLQTDTKRV